jgi:hypothetical protein
MDQGEKRLGTSPKKALELPEWWLSEVFELDTYAPGFGASAIRASNIPSNGALLSGLVSLQSDF